MGKKAIDTSLLDRAMIFAIEAHKNVERRGKNFPYVVHPMEAVAIVASMTSDQELLAAAALHDVVEDTDYTVEDIRREFGDRVAELVHTESDIEVKGMTAGESWHIRKQAAMDRLRNASRDAQIVAMGDKLSNLRAIHRDYMEMGDELWKIFHVTDRYEHEWHYRGLMEALASLSDTAAYNEFKHLLNEIFSEEAREKLIFDRELALKMFAEEGMNRISTTRLDFTYVKMVNFSGLRELIRAKKMGYKFRIVNVGNTAANMFFYAGMNDEFEIIKKAGMLNFDQWEEFGRGAHTTSYNMINAGAMIKLYDENVDPKVVENEKVKTLEVQRLGIPTPLGGGLVRHINRYGMVFERIPDKMSISRMLGEKPEKAEKLGTFFAEMVLDLHSRECNTEIFPSMVKILTDMVLEQEIFDDACKLKLIRFLAAVPQGHGCLHGELVPANVIVSEGEGYFIDLSGFCYGCPEFDLGALYYSVYLCPDEECESRFHCRRETLIRMWESFVRTYVPERELSRVNEWIRPYAGFKALHYTKEFGMTDHLRNVIQRCLIDM